MTVIVFWTLIFAVTGLCAAMLVAAVWIRSIVRPNWLRARQTYGSPQEHGFPAEDVTLPGGIYGWWAHNPNAEFAVLLVHGRSRRAGWMYPYAKLLWPRASILAIDLPGHGQSRYALVSYGVRESKTVTDAVQWLAQKQPLPILVLGVSMGGASAILAQANHPSKRVCALITVGAYDAIENVFKNVATSSGLAWGWTRPIFRLAGVIAGFDLQTYRPVDHVAKLSVPFIAIQGSHDELVHPSSAQRLAGAGDAQRCTYAYYDGPHDDPSHRELHQLIHAFVDAQCGPCATGTPPPSK